MPCLRLLMVLLLLAMPPWLRAATPESVPAADDMAPRVLACVACHGREGRATNQGYFPRIAGKPAGYLYNQLRNFRDGRRTNAALTHLESNGVKDTFVAAMRAAQQRAAELGDEFGR